MTQISDERLAEMLAWAECHDANLKEPINIGDFMNLIAELQSLRASIPGGVEVKGLEWLGEEGSPGKDIRAYPTPEIQYTVRHLDMDTFDVILNTDLGSKWFRNDGQIHASYAQAKAAAQADYERRILSALDLLPADTQCCMCGKTGLSTLEGDGGTECQLEDGRWTCSEPCWEKAGGYGPDLSSAEGEPVGLFRKSDGAWKQVPDEWADHPNVQPLYASPSNKEPVAVTDEMVERTVQAWPDGLSDPRNKIAMRAALTAALSVKPQSGSDKP